MERLKFAIDIVREAGQLVLDSRVKKIEISSKGGDWRDVLTSIDLEVNEFIRHKIATVFPGETIHSEEYISDIDNSNTYWSIDPIDGTSNFARNIPHYASVISYIENGEVAIGAIYNPVTKELWSFEKGRGAFLNGEKISVSTVSNISEAYVLLHIGRKENVREWGLNLQRFLLGNAKKNINLASSALDLAFLASGRVDLVIYGTMTTRDIAAAIGLVREAGGEVFDEVGNPATISDKSQKIFGVSNRLLYKDILNIS